MPTLTDPEVREAQERKNKNLADARAIHQRAVDENRDLTDDEQRTYRQYFDAAMDAGAEVSRTRAQIDRENELAEAEQRAAEETLRRRAGAPDDLETRGDGQRGQAADSFRRGESVRMRVGQHQMTLEPKSQRSGLFHRMLDPDYERAFARFLSDKDPQFSEPEARAVREVRDLQTNINTQGGYLAPTKFVAELLKDLDNLVWFRSLATVWPVTMAGGLGFPTIEADPEDADWTAEITQADLDTATTFGRREFTPHLCSKLVAVSMRLLMASPIDVDAVVRERLAYKFAVTQEKAFLTGTGANEPLGVFTATSQGISTGRDISTGNTTTAIGAGGLFNAKYALTKAHRAGATWLFHRDALADIAQLKGNDTYYWQPALSADAPDRLLGLDVAESEYVPNTFTTGQYVGIVGNFRRGYYIADLMAFEVQRLNELLARTSQIGFLGRMFTDGMPVLENAFARVTLA